MPKFINKKVTNPYRLKQQKVPRIYKNLSDFKELKNQIKLCNHLQTSVISFLKMIETQIMNQMFNVAGKSYMVQ